MLKPIHVIIFGSMASVAMAGYLIWAIYASSIESMIPVLVDNLHWIIPVIILVAVVPHLLRVVRSHPWRLLLLVGILAVGGAQPILFQRIYEGRLTGRAIDAAGLLGYLSVLAFAGLVLFAKGFRIFAFGLALLVVFWRST